MEIREFAERLLFGHHLEDKLFDFKIITDNQRGKAIDPPDFPGRPQELRFEKKQYPFPKVHELNDEKKRALILHFFANHELLAIELMALVLLKFPDAPTSFRSGVIQTIREEQEHMRLYIQRMKELGVQLGEIPVNDFFWKTMKNILSPMEYVTQMSLTFEQANLDFSIYYKDLIQKLGDHKTATVLQKVFIDELRHVKFGFQWFKKWQDPELSQWQNYCHHLTFPITPMRAKGAIFYKKIREDIGFEKEYIEELELFSQSKGRAPNIYFFNPNCEMDYQKTLISLSKKFIKKNNTTQQLMEDLENSPMFYAQADDIILVKEKPSSSFLKKMKTAGFSLPEFQIYNQTPLTAIKRISQERKLHQFAPWGWTPHLKNNCKKQDIPTNTDSSISQLRNLFSKVYSAQLCQEFINQSHNTAWGPQSITGEIYETPEDIQDYINFWHKEKNLELHPLVIKCPYGLSGQGQRIIKHPSQWEHIKTWVNKALQQQAQLIVEPWLEKKFDFSIQIQVLQEKSVVKGIARFLTDHQGHYLGALINNVNGFLKPDTKQFLYKRNNWKKSIEELSLFIHKKMRQQNYTGPIGVDSFVYRDKQDDRLYFKPLVEINPRYNMGRITIHLSSHIKKENVGIWLIFHKNQIIKEGFNHLHQFSQKMEQLFPLETYKKDLTSNLTQQRPLISSGYLATSSVKSSSDFMSCLVVASSEDKLISMLKNIFPPIVKHILI